MSSCLRVSIVALLVAGATAEAEEPSISWEQALERAQRTGESLLVEVGATWCHACNVLETRTMADSTVRRAVSADWIVVRVDVDRRPDLHRLFHARGHEGLPTLHFLDPGGREVMRSGYVDPAALVGMLETARRPGSMELLPNVEVTAPSVAEDFEAILSSARERLLSDEDTTYGGFGRRSKYIVGPETDFLLALNRSGDASAAASLRRFAASVTESLVHDAEDGGFHRYSEARDWSDPHYEKLLAVQAVMMEVLATDALVNPAAYPENLATVRRTWRFLHSFLRDPASGLFFGSLDADVQDPESGAVLESGDEYYGRPSRFGMISSGYGRNGARARLASERRPGPHPAVDRVLLADANARLGSALIVCAQVFAEPAFATSARKLVDGIRSELAAPDGGFLRYRAAVGSEPAYVEDVGEIGLLLLTIGGQKSEEAVALGRRLVEDYIDDVGGLLPRRVEHGTSPVADVGEDGARTIVFLAELGRATGDEAFVRAAERAFVQLGRATPAPAPAALGLAAEAILRADARFRLTGE